MNKRQIIDYLENYKYFRDYRFRSSKYWGKDGKPGTLNILNPMEHDLDNAVSKFGRDGFGTIVIYLSEKRLNPPKVKRIKQVFSSSQEVYHLWAAQTQSHARQAGRGRSFFYDQSCYSYGRHYEVGRLVKINGVQCALINRTGYSNTTSKHIREASSAVSHMPQIDVDSSFNWKRGLLKMQSDLIDGMFNTLNRISFWKGSKVYDKYDREQFEEFNKLCRTVGMKHLQLFPDKETVDVLNQYIKARLKRQEELDAYKNMPEYAAKQAEKMQRELIEAEKARLERAIKDQVEVEAWKQGGPHTNAVSRLHPQLIRIKGNNVETSARATVPLSDACRALMHIENRKLKQGDKIGNFEFTSLDGDTVTIGCHKISLKQAKDVLSNMRKVG